jgi:four helix bundle protein
MSGEVNEGYGMNRARSFTDLLVWQKSHQFVLEVYRASESFPRAELFGLTSQLRRAAVSIPANIAEGFRRSTLPDKLRLYNVAQGSLEECRYYLILTRDLNYADTSTLLTAIAEVSRLLDAYTAKIRAEIPSQGRSRIWSFF